ncbi:metalloregulator ArsR/SmtB family transcription factor [Paraglaciecola sp. Hal342]
MIFRILKSGVFLCLPYFVTLSFYKCLSDDTRLKALMLIYLEKELCVCDLITALELSQPKVSRHLADLRKCQILLDERRGKWVYYSVNPKLPEWAMKVLELTAHNTEAYLNEHITNLNMAKQSECCS